MCLFSMDSLRNSLLALAASPEVQDSLYPDFTAKGDELVLDFGESFETVELCKLTTAQAEALKSLDNFLTAHSGEAFSDMYLDVHSLYSDPRWDEIRKLASVAIEALGWPVELPRKNSAIYVNGGFGEEHT